MSIKHALLGSLAGGSRHGYELKADLESELLPLSEVNFGQVYSTLERLERDGLVRHETVEQDDRPAKKVFELTPAGRAELRAWVVRPAVPDLDLRNATFLKLLLVGRLGPGTVGSDVTEVLQSERRAAFERLHEVASARVERDGTVATGLLLDLAAFRLEAFLKWLDACESALGAAGAPAAVRTTGAGASGHE